MAKASEALAIHYQSLSDDEVLNLALNQQELAEEAVAALHEELHFRGLTEDSVHEYESWAKVHLEQAHESLQSEGDTQAEPEAPTELPADWFDTKADASATTLVSARPKGVTAAAFLFWGSGLISSALGVAIVLNPEGLLLRSLAGLVALAWGVAAFFSAFGLWRLKRWARISAEVLCWISLLNGAGNITFDAVESIRGAGIEPQTALRDFATCLFGMLWVVYFGRADIRKAFAAAARVNSSRTLES